MGGWGAQGSNRDARVARLRITSLQKMVARVIHESSHRRDGNSTADRVHSEEEKVRCVSGGDFSRVSCSGQQFQVQEVEPTDEVMDLAVDPEPELDVVLSKLDGRRRMNSLRSASSRRRSPKYSFRSELNSVFCSFA